MNSFTSAIVRRPCRNFADGITGSKLGKPIYSEVLIQHEAYCEALIKCGLNLKILEADEKFPDSCFVEDTAIITRDVAIITNSGAPERQGEEKKIIEAISDFKNIEFISNEGKLDGGDILRVDNHFYIGLSGRTNKEGAQQLSDILVKYGYTSSQIRVNGVLHLKTGVTYLENNTFISVNEFSEYFGTSNIIIPPKGEEYSANCLIVNEHVLIPKGFPISKSKIVNLGYKPIEIEMSEFRKMDGGLTCLSLLY